MPGKDAFTVEGIVVKRLGPGLFRVKLPNGHQLIAHGARKNQERADGLGVNDNVVVQLSPYDLSKGRLVFERLDNES